MKKSIKYKLIKTIKKIFKIKSPSVNYMCKLVPLAQLVEHQIKSPSVNYTSHYDDEEKGRKL
ncbi:hypothetical protein [Anaerococcus senegalensis]|uniref:hypothetical protein n=1 Tax=Anaerococcus senegalensis TaxID=1288120 RepID=UPI00058ADF92|nr:hypothetical protein [Anaerococcus senegalensis]